MAPKPAPIPKAAAAPAPGSLDATIQNAFAQQTSTSATGEQGSLAKSRGTETVKGAANLFGVTGSTLTAQQSLDQFVALGKSNPAMLAQLQTEMYAAGIYGTSKNSRPNYGVMTPKDVAAFTKVITQIGLNGTDIQTWLGEQSAWNQATGLTTGSSTYQYNYPKVSQIDSPAKLQMTFQQTMESVQGRMPTASEMAGFTSYMQQAEHQAGIQEYSGTARYARQLAQQQKELSLAQSGNPTNSNSNWFYPKTTPAAPASPGPAKPNGIAGLPGSQAGVGVNSPNPPAAINPQGGTATPTSPEGPAIVAPSSSNSGTGSAAAAGSKTKNPTTPPATQGRYIDPTSAMHFAQQTATVWGVKVAGTQSIAAGKQDVTAVQFTAPDNTTAQEFYKWAEQYTGQNGLYSSVKLTGGGALGTSTISVTYAKNAGAGAQAAILQLGSAMANQGADPASINKQPSNDVVDVITPDPTSQAWQQAWNTDPDRAEALQNAPAAEGAVQKVMGSQFGPQSNPTAGA